MTAGLVVLGAVAHLRLRGRLCTSRRVLAGSNDADRAGFDTSADRVARIRNTQRYNASRIPIFTASRDRSRARDRRGHGPDRANDPQPGSV